MEPLAMMTLTIPIFLPLVTNLDINLIWFGVIVVQMMELGMITPPIGMNLFAISSFTDIPLERIIYGSSPFLLANLTTITLIILFPQIALFIPSHM